MTRETNLDERLDEGLTEFRREIRRRPELAGEERETAEPVAQHLRDAGLEVTTGIGGHGVVAVSDGSADGPTVAYRADMPSPTERAMAGLLTDRLGACGGDGDGLGVCLGSGVR